MMNSKSTFKILLCFALFTITPTNDADAQAGRAVKSAVTKTPNAISRFFGKKAAKEASEEALEQATKKISKEITQRSISKNAANSLIDPAAAKISRDALQQVYDINIKKTLAAKVGKEVSEVALRSTSKEFAQYIGKSASQESADYFAKKLGTEASQDLYEVSAKKSMQKSAFDTHKSWWETLKDKYHTLRLQLLHTIKKSKLYKDLLDIYAKGPISLKDRDIKILFDETNPKNAKNHLKALMKANKVRDNDLIEFLIRLKKSNPEHVKQILDNPALKPYIESYIRKTSKKLQQGGAHEWLMTKNLKSFLTDSKWGEEGDILALALCRFSQKTDNVTFKVGGKHVGKGGGMNSTTFHNILSTVIEQSAAKEGENFSIEKLFINIRRYAKKVLTEDSYNEFLKILESVFEAA